MIRRGKSLRIVSTFMFIVKDKSDCFLEAGKERWSIIDLCLLSRPTPAFYQQHTAECRRKYKLEENIICWNKIIFDRRRKMIFVGTK